VQGFLYIYTNYTLYFWTSSSWEMKLMGLWIIKRFFHLDCPVLDLLLLLAYIPRLYFTYLRLWLMQTKYIHFFLFYCCAECRYIVGFAKLLTLYQIYPTWIHHIHHSPLFPPPLISGIVSTGISFPITLYLRTQYLHYIHSPMPFPYLLSPPTGIKPLRQELFCLSVGKLYF
jgi:hypothetical protein